MAPYMDFEPDLKKLGLSDKEAAVYLATLGLGPSTVQQIGRRAKVARATTYLVLDSLVKTGLVTKYESEGKTLFAADNPLQLERILEKREEHLKESRQDLEELLPRLQAFVQASDDRPVVRYYDGLDGLKRIRSEMTMYSHPGDIWRHFSPIDAMRAVFKEEDFTYVQQRKAKRIHSRSIFTTKSNKVKAELLDSAQKKWAERKFIDPKRYTSSSGATFFAGRVALATYGGKMGATIIESESVAQMMAEFFDLLWDSLD